MIALSPMWRLGGLTWKGVARHVFRELREDGILGLAAQLAFYFLLSIFPFLLFLVTLAGMLLQSADTTRQALTTYLASIAPEATASLLDEVVRQVTSDSGVETLSIGLAIAIWAASSGVVAISNALNRAYDIEETRPWWKRRLVAVGLTVALWVLVLAAVMVIFFGADYASRTAAQFGYGEAFVTAWSLLQWPVVLAFVLFAFNLIYLYAPNLEHWNWHWLMPGTVVGVGLWLLGSLGFKLYIENFGRYSATYGSLGTVIILLLWFYITGIALIVGGEVNSVIERASPEVGDVETREEKFPELRRRSG